MTHRPGIGGTFIKPLTDDPRARQKSDNDQSEYRAEIEAYYARNPSFRRSAPVTVYVPPPRPVGCSRWCRNGYHAPECLGVQ